MSPSDPEPDERRIHEMLRALPARSAPRTLEMRVLAELRRRQAGPWRGALILLSAVAAAALAAGPERLLNALARHVAWVAALQSVGASLCGTIEDVLLAIPPAWLYAALAAVIACSAALAGLGAAAYRIVCKRPTRPSS